MNRRKHIRSWSRDHPFADQQFKHAVTDDLSCGKRRDLAGQRQRMNCLDAARGRRREIHAALAGCKINNQAAVLQPVDQRFVDNLRRHGIEDHIRIHGSATEFIAAEAHRRKPVHRCRGDVLRASCGNGYMRADAVKQQRILEAEGEAQAILAVQKANADAIRLLNEAMPTDKVLALRSLEALAKVANGKATKIIIPSDLQNLGGVVPSIKELMTDPKDAE